MILLVVKILIFVLVLLLAIRINRVFRSVSNLKFEFTINWIPSLLCSMVSVTSIGDPKIPLQSDFRDPKLVEWSFPVPNIGNSILGKFDSTDGLKKCVVSWIKERVSSLEIANLKSILSVKPDRISEIHIFKMVNQMTNVFFGLQLNLDEEEIKTLIETIRFFWLANDSHHFILFDHLNINLSTERMIVNKKLESLFNKHKGDLESSELFKRLVSHSFKPTDSYDSTLLIYFGSFAHLSRFAVMYSMKMNLTTREIIRKHTPGDSIHRMIDGVRVIVPKTEEVSMGYGSRSCPGVHWVEIYHPLIHDYLSNYELDLTFTESLIKGKWKETNLTLKKLDRLTVLLSPRLR